MKRSFFSFCLLLFVFSVKAQQTVGLFLNDSLAQNGYTLFSPNQTTYLIDNCGFLVNSWRSVNRPGLSVYLREDGTLLRTGNIIGDFMGAGVGGRIEIYNWEGDLEWTYDFSNEEHQQHHDIEPLPNGNILVLAWESIPMQVAIAAGRDSAITNKNVWPDKIVEIKPIGNNDAEIIWEWHAWDHLIQDKDNAKDNFGIITNHPELIDVNYAAIEGAPTPGVTGIDWLHCNGLSYNASRDEIVLSVRNFSEIWVIDHSTTSEEAASHSGGNSGKGGDLLYRWGNPQTYRRGTAIDQQFFQQHDPKWVPDHFPNAGKLMVYNNGNGRPVGMSYSSIDFIDPPLNPSGQYIIEGIEAIGPDTLSSTFDQFQNDYFFSSIMSGAHALPNGNVFVCVSEGGHFFELAPNGKVVWDYLNPVSTNGPVSQGSGVPFQMVFRATKYPEDYLAFIGKDLTPGDPIELSPLLSDCMIYSDLNVATAEVLSLEDIAIQPNPFSSFLLLENLQEQEVELKIFDATGRQIYQRSGTTSHWNIPTEEWENAWYIVSVFSKTKNRIWYKKLVKF